MKIRCAYLLCSLAMGLSIGLTSVPQAISASAHSKSRAAVKRTGTPAFRERQIFRIKVSNNVSRGEQQLLSGQYQQAADTFRQALNKNSKDVSALAGLGFALSLQFKLDGADEQFDKALKVSPKDSLSHVGKALTKLNRLQSSSMTIIKQRQNILASAENECRIALKNDPGMPEALTTLGMVQKEQGRLDDAVNSFSKAIDSDPQYGMAYTHRGIAELQMNNPVQAADDFKKAISLRSSNSTAHFGMGRALLAQGQVDAALKELNTALSLNRNSAPIHIALGDAYGQQGNTVAAVAQYQEAIRIKAENEDAYIKLADIRESRGDLEIALAELRSGATLNPGSAPLHRRIGDIALRLEKTDDAIREYNTDLSINPGDSDAVIGLTRAYVIKAQKDAQGAYFMSNNFEDAERQIQQAIKLNPNDLELRLADAKFRAMAGMPVNLEAVGTPTNDPERIAYAEAAMAQFKFQDAAAAMQAVINNTNNPKQLFAVADIALMTRDLDSAQAAYTKAGTLNDPDAAARSRRGLNNVATARESANKELRLASDLARKKQLGSAIDRYRDAAYQNPRLAPAHLGLAEALKKYFSNDPASLREAALHLRADVSLSPDMPPKQQEKLLKEADKLVAKAAKIEQKTIANKR